MKLKSFLIVMTMVAVVSDYLLHPFYPQFFEARFGVTDPKVVGYYFGAICFMVMVAFPFWAYVSKKIPELNILVYTQCIAGILALYCYWTSSYFNFWIVSLLMVLFKGSYLLVYPYILKIISPQDHPSTIGVLSVVVHLGGIMGAVIGGLVVDLIAASYIFLIMAAGDFIQMGLSIYLINSKSYDTKRSTIAEALPKAEKRILPKGFILKIGLITMILYFSDFLIRPFFSSYWEHISVYDSTLVSGFMYAIPGFVALAALWVNSKRTPHKSGYHGIVTALLLGVLGLLLQGIPSEITVIIGRVIYGWALFQGMVKFDVLVFQLSTPSSYALDYSKIHFFQNLGVLLSSLSVGILVDLYGVHIPFTIALVGFGSTLILYYVLFKAEIKIRFKRLAKI